MIFKWKKYFLPGWSCAFSWVRCRWRLCSTAHIQHGPLLRMRAARECGWWRMCVIWVVCSVFPSKVWQIGWSFKPKTTGPSGNSDVPDISQAWGNDLNEGSRGYWTLFSWNLPLFCRKWLFCLHKAGSEVWWPADALLSCKIDIH